MNREQLVVLKQNAESTLSELVDILNHSPHLSGLVKPLIHSTEILNDFQALANDNPETAEQLLRIAMAFMVNHHTVAEISSKLK